MIRDKNNMALLQGYKSLIISYIWVNQQHNGANQSSKPLNITLFLRIYDNNQRTAHKGYKKILVGGGDSPFMGYGLPHPPTSAHESFMSMLMKASRAQAGSSSICGQENKRRVPIVQYGIRGGVKKRENLGKIPY